MSFRVEEVVEFRGGFSGGRRRFNVILEDSTKRRKEWKRKRRGGERGEGNKEVGKSDG